MVFVKICGITNLEDAMAAASAGADALGFNFYRRSSRFIAPAAARRIIEKLPSGVLCVGVFVNQSGPEEIERLAAEAGIGAIQLHGDESPGYAQALSRHYVIKALRVDSSFEPESALAYQPGAILLDAFDSHARGGTGHSFDWQVARRTAELIPKLFLAGGLNVENVGDAIAAARPYAVDACSGLESAPGRKDKRRVEAFVKNAKDQAAR